MDYKKDLIVKINNKTAVTGIIGLGYVGLPLALTFAENGFETIGFDIDDKKIPVLNGGCSYINHISSSRIQRSITSGKFRATTDFSQISSCDAVILCVPTPLDESNEPDLSFVKNSAQAAAEFVKPGQLVILESSTYPGTTEEILLPMFNEKFSKLTGGKNGAGEIFFLAFSPEREDPGNKEFSTGTIPKLIGGITENCLETASALYGQVIKQVVPASSARVAEAAKLLENIYRSVNIALVNELKMVFDKMNIDVWEVIEAAKTKPFGFQAFYPGPGLGGHCIPIDPFYLTWKAKEYGINSRFIELAGEINTNMPEYVIQKTIDALKLQRKELRGSKILVAGVSYKKNIDDMRETPALRLIELLVNAGTSVDYHDPYFPELPPARKYKFEMKSIQLDAHTIASYDLVLLSTDHDLFDYDLLSRYSKLIVDTRNAFGSRKIFSDKIIKA